jgi:hypothetical protein
MKSTSALLLLAGVFLRTACGKTTQAEPVKVGDVVVSGSLRTRVESWAWFSSNANNVYTFPGSLARIGFSEATKTFDWQFELAAPFLLGLPSDAIGAGAQGQLGLGASYNAANQKDTSVGMVFAKQGFFRFKNLGGVEGQTLKNLGFLELLFKF